MQTAPQPADLIITGLAQVATPLGNHQLAGSDLDSTILAGVAVVVKDGLIAAIGDEETLEQEWAATMVVESSSGVLIPGFVDAHTHPIFFGTREEEFEMRVAGRSYLEISQAGGGIISSLRGVREASKEELLGRLLGRLDRFMELGTTTIEAKTGYGLTTKDEMKCLEVLAQANSEHAIEIVPTFLGAHDFPPEYRERHGEYIELLINEMLPRVAESGLAEYCDIFTESHVFGLEDSRRVMRRGAELGLGIRMHVDQLTPLGGAQLAAELGAASADHLECVTPEGIEALAAAQVIPVLCPLVPLYLRQKEEAPAREMIRGGLAPALATDFNPGSCYVQSMPEVMTWAALRYGMSTKEVLAAGTLNAACSLGRGDRLGSIEVGKQADLVLLDVPDYRHLTYEFGRNPVCVVIKKGEVVYERMEDV
ncbi:MAG: imidazolonepropionase [Planctomycetota bacterium]|jgi:imidazolonepropionase